MTATGTKEPEFSTAFTLEILYIIAGENGKPSPLPKEEKLS